MAKKVVIDAGHGGSDSGAIGNGIIEKNLTLDISKYMYDRLKELGVPVKLTRDSDVDLPASERPQKVLDQFGNGSDVIVVSNHINSGGNGMAEGAEVIYALRNKDTLAKKILDELEIKSPKDKNIENDIKVVEDIDLKKELEKTEKYEEDEQSQIDEELKEIYNLISYVPKNINYIAMKSKCGISNVNQKLIILELKGYIKSLPGNNYVRC